MTRKRVADETGSKQCLPFELVGQLTVKWEELMRRIRQGTINPQRALNDLQQLIEGKTFGPYWIDCAVDPFCPEDWKVEKHKKQGNFKWNSAKVHLYLSPNQKDGKCIRGDELQEELKAQATLNANVLDYLLAHQELIPESWKGKAVFFWGTVYRRADDNLYVRYLHHDGGSWSWNCCWFKYGFHGRTPAAVFA